MFTPVTYTDGLFRDGERRRRHLRKLLALPILLLLAAMPLPPAHTNSEPSAGALSLSGMQAKVQVKIIQMNDQMPMYQPSHLVITSGQMVQWRNNGQVSHSVVDDARQAAKPEDSLLPRGTHPFSSGNIMPGSTFQHIFTQSGRYRYFCASHELDGMIGEIIVKPPSKDPVSVISHANS